MFEPKNVADALVQLSCALLDYHPSEIARDERAWGAYFDSEVADPIILDRVNWKTIEYEVKPEDQLFSTVQPDIDVGESLFHELDLNLVPDFDPETRNQYATQGGLTGLRIASLGGEPVLDKFKYLSVDWKLKSAGFTIVDALNAMFNLQNGTPCLQPGQLMGSQDWYEIDDRHLPWIEGIEPEPLRFHIGAFFQNYRTAESGMTFVDEHFRRERFEMLQLINPLLGEFRQQEGMVDSLTWNHCPRNYHGLQSSIHIMVTQRKK